MVPLWTEGSLTESHERGEIDCFMTVVDMPPSGKESRDNPQYVRGTLCTESYSAALFAGMCAGITRWTPGWGWLYYDGRRWRRDDIGKVVHMAKALGMEYRTMAEMTNNAKSIDYLITWARRVESARGIESVLKLAENLCLQERDTFDTNPWILNVNSHTLNFGDIDDDGHPAATDHHPDDLLTRVAPADWYLAYPEMRWSKFLEEILPSPEVRAFVQRAVGYSLLGTTREQCFFICWGSGANGKSTFLSTLLHALGPDYATQADPASFMAHRNVVIRNDLARLRGVRFLSAIETGEGGRLDEPLVKAATGGDPIVARYLYEEPFTFVPEFKLWLATNHRPTIRGTDNAIWRRIYLLPFDQTIPEDKRDRKLDRLLRVEAPLVLCWAVEGAVAYLEEGLNPPEEVCVATNEYRAGEDIVGQFLAECTVSRPHALVGASQLYAAFREWSGITFSQTRFGRQLIQRGIDRVTHRGSRFYIGLALKSGDS